MRKIRIFIFAFILSASTFAQHNFMHKKYDSGYGIGFSFMHPNYKASVSELSSLSGIYNFYGYIKAGKFNIEAIVPVSKIDYSDDTFLNLPLKDESALGNIYLGASKYTKYSETHSMLLSFGVNLPTADDEKLSAQLYSTFANYRYYYFYLWKTYSLTFNLRHYYKVKDLFDFSFEFGALLAMRTEKKYGENEGYFNYGLGIDKRFEYFGVNLEYYGLFHFSESYDKFKDKFYDSFSAKISFNKFRLRPSVFISFNLDKRIKEFVNRNIGFGLEYLIK